MKKLFSIPLFFSLVIANPFEKIHFNAINDDVSNDNQVIKTKTLNEDFVLKILILNDKNKSVNGNGSDVRYSFVDENDENISNIYMFSALKDFRQRITKYDLDGNPHKKVRVKFKYCVNTSFNDMLVSYENCLNNHSFFKYEFKTNYSDYFSIKPKIEINSDKEKVKVGEKIKITIDNKENIIYNKIITKRFFIHKETNESFDLEFLTTGKKEIQLIEKEGEEFAKIDENDTDKDERLIKSNILEFNVSKKETSKKWFGISKNLSETNSSKRSSNININEDVETNKKDFQKLNF